MLELDEKPILERSLEIAEQLPLKRWTVVVGYQSKQISEYINSRVSSAPKRFVRQNEQSGIVHAMRIALHLLDDDILLNLGDEFLVNDRLGEMVEYFSSNNVDFVCGVIENSLEEKIRKAYSIQCNPHTGFITSAKEKPTVPYNSMLGTGYCIFSKEILPYLNEVTINLVRNQYELCDFITLLVKKGKRGVCIPIGDDLINVNTYEELNYLRRIGGQKA